MVNFVPSLPRMATALLILSLGCTEEPTLDAPAAQRKAPVVEDADSPFVAFPLKARAGAREILEVASDGRMVVGTSVAVPPRSTAKLMFDATYVDTAGNESSIPFAARVQDVRFAFAPSPLLAVLDDRDELTVWNTRTGATHRIDGEVFPGFAFDHAGKTIVYAKGLGPELEAFRVRLPSSTPEQLTSGGVPVWGFAFSPDDSRIVYVDAPDGFPCLTLMPSRGGSRERLTNRTVSPADVMAGKTLAPYPDGRRPPIWAGPTVYVQDTAGVHAIDAFGKVVFDHPGGRDLHLGISGKSVLFRDGSGVRGVGR